MTKRNGRDVGRPGSRGDSETLDIFETRSEPTTTTVHRGLARKDRILNETERRKKEALAWLRDRLVELYRRRRQEATSTAGWGEMPNVHVSADDARDLYYASRFPATYSKDFKFAAAIFRDKRFHQTGDRIISKHPENNGRKIDCWAVVE